MFEESRRRGRLIDDYFSIASVLEEIDTYCFHRSASGPVEFGEKTSNSFLDRAFIAEETRKCKDERNFVGYGKTSNVIQFKILYDTSFKVYAIAFDVKKSLYTVYV